LGATTTNHKGEHRGVVLEHGDGVGALSVEAAPALKADQVVRLESSGPSLWADIGLRVLGSIWENRLFATAGSVAFFSVVAGT